LPGFDGAIDVKKFGYGASNPTYFVSTSSGQKYVLRKKPPGKLIKGAHAVEREFRVMKALEGKSFEVPRMHVLCEDCDVIGTPFYVMGFVKGQIPDNGLASLPRQHRRPAMLAIVRALAKLHSFDPVELGLMETGNTFGKSGGFYERQIRAMSRTSENQVAGSVGKVGPLMAMPELLKQFAAHMPLDRSCVIHGDYKPDNILLSEGDSTPKVLAIVDWELSTIGHPLSDLANLCLPYHLGPLGALVKYGPFDMSGDSGLANEEEVHKSYCEVTGVPFPIADWTFFVAFSCFRLAVIVQGVAMRAALGQGSSQGGEHAVAQMCAVVGQLSDIALQKMKDHYGQLAKL
jgi:aminoglycoside phosphotransferase (APT) family kinase protein